MKVLFKTILTSLATLFVIFLVVLFLMKPESLIITINKILPNTSSSHNLAAIHSNQWYSSVYKSFPSQPLYTFPLAFRFTSQGLGFSYPDVVKTPQAIHAPYVEDITVGSDDVFSKQIIEEISDWSINATLTNPNNNSLNFTIGHGLPFTTIKSSGKDLTLTSPQPFLLYPENQQSEFKGKTLSSKPFVLTTRNHSYLIVFPSNTSLSSSDQKIVSNSSTVFVALLDNRDHYDEFLKIASVQLTGTRITYKMSNNVLKTNYDISTTTSTPPLLAILPHQKDFLVPAVKSLGTYDSIRGPLEIIKTKNFTTEIRLTALLPTFPTLTSVPPGFLQQLVNDTEKVLSQEPPKSRDYYLGTYFGKVSSLIQLTESHGLTVEGKKLRNHLKPLFLESMTHFGYDATKTSFIAKKSEFGNDQLNDHHFHYGYYIRAAAILSKEDPGFLKSVRGFIAEMVEDVATIDRSSSRYPALRNFDGYEGHSWASGFAEFADGNNQESSSEALNVWYALTLWADVVSDTKLKNTALYLFNTEFTSIKYYWFNKHNTYSIPYSHQIASIIWGGKVDFSTWFSPKTNMIYGIQLLPFTPASLYLQDIIPFEKYETDFIRNGGDYSSEWGELMLMWKSLSSTSTSNSFQNRQGSLQEDNLLSLYLYFINYNLQK